MFKPLSTVLAGVLAGAVLAAVGLSAASAAPAAGQTTAEQLTQIRDRLDAATGQQDAAAVRSAVNDLSPVLAGVRHDLERGLAPMAAADPLAATEKQTADLSSALNQTGRDGIFDSIKQMVQKLVDDLKQLLQQLLGGSSTSPTKPTDPSKPTQPTDPTQPTSPTQPTAPGGAPTAS